MKGQSEMKINKDSWHFKLMLYYRYIRFMKLASYERPDGWQEWCWKNNKPSYDDEVSFEEFSLFSEEAGKLPIDFCTYWRGVLLFPLWHTFVWTLLAFWTYILVSNLNWGSAAIIGGSFFAIIAAMVGLGYGIHLIVEKLAAKRWNKPKEPGFFDNLKKSVNDHNVCSMVEYVEKDKE